MQYSRMSTKKIACFTVELTPRFEYIIQLIFNQLLGLNIEICVNVSQWEQYANTCRLAYVPADWATRLADCPIIPATGLLSQTIIQPQNIDIQLFNKIPIGFGVAALAQTQHLSFDALAWCFYLVSRYEEYLPFETDAHGRFGSRQSLAFQHDFIQMPVVNLVANAVGEWLHTHYPTLEITRPTYSFLPSYDIDYMYAFRAKSWWRKLGSLTKNILNLDSETIKNQLFTWAGKREDPYFTFDYLEQLHNQYNTNALYFFLVGDWGEFDKNIAHTHPLYRDCVKRLATTHTIGLHPSYRSNKDWAQLQTEQKRLENIINQPITRSRQHFLKLHLPQTYRQLLALGIREDYSMGYADAVGFRASVATPFFWFDLLENKPTNLKIYPLSVMDVTLHTYLRLSPDAALALLAQHMEQVRAVGGCFVPLWHNNSLCECGDWRGWRRVYETLLALATQ